MSAGIGTKFISFLIEKIEPAADLLAEFQFFDATVDPTPELSRKKSCTSVLALLPWRLRRSSYCDEYRREGGTIKVCHG
jgi:hypothetical protein